MTIEHTQEKCLLLLKPDCINRRFVGKLLQRIEDTGLNIVQMNMVIVDANTIGEHYPNDPAWLKSVGLKKIKKLQGLGKPVKEDSQCIGKTVRKHLIEYFTGQRIVAIVVQGPNAITCMRKLAGNTEPFTAVPGTIRGDFSTDSYEIADSAERPIHNLIHVSDSPESSEREIAIWFPETTN